MIRTPVNVHVLNHEHSPYIRALSPKSADEIAQSMAWTLQVQVAKDDNAEQDVLPEPVSYPVAAALGPRRWLIDTGTPFDIVSVNDINAEAESHKIRAENNVTLNAVGGLRRRTRPSAYH